MTFVIGVSLTKMAIQKADKSLKIRYFQLVEVFLQICRFNVSCDCESSKKGYFWRSRGNNCEDINECEDQSVCPLGKHCVYTEGGYQCICPPGTTENPRTTKCEVVVSKTPVSKVVPRQNPSSGVDTIAYPADSSGFEDSGSSNDAFEGLTNRQENIDKPSSGMNNPRQTHTEARTDGWPSTNIRPSEKAGTETNHETATISEQEPSFETQTAKFNAYSAFKSPKQHHEGKQQPEVINYDIYSSKGKVVSQTDRKHRQQKSQQDKDKTVTDGEQGEIDDSETFLSGFVGFVSSGNRVTTSWLFVFGQVSLILCQREVVNLF